MSDRRARERTQQRVTASRRLREHGSGNRTSVMLPAGVKVFAPKEQGTYELEIIPFTAGGGNPHADEGDLYYERTYFVHFGVGPNNDAYICAAKTFNEPCCICEWRQREVKRPVYDKETVDSLAPKERQLWNVYNHDKPEDGVCIFDCSFHLFGKHLDNKIDIASKKDKPRYEAFADPDEGLTVKVGAIKTTRGGRTFLDFNQIEFVKREKPITDEMLAKAVCLDNCLRKMDQRKLSEIFLQTSADDGDVPDDATVARTVADDDQPPPQRTRRAEPEPEAPPARQRRVVDPEPEPEKPAPAAKAAPADDPTAQELGIEVGMTVYHPKHKECKVFHVSSDGSALRLQNPEGEIFRAIAPGDVEIVKVKKKASLDDEEPPRRAAPAAEAPAPAKPRTRLDDDIPLESEDDLPPRRR